MVLEDQKKEVGARLRVAEREELKQLADLLRAPEKAWSPASLLSSNDEAVIVSDDPIWERYMGYVKAKSVEAIPDSWFGSGEEGVKRKAKMLAKEKAKK